MPYVRGVIRYGSKLELFRNEHQSRAASQSVVITVRESGLVVQLIYLTTCFTRREAAQTYHSMYTDVRQDVHKLNELQVDTRVIKAFSFDTRRCY